MAALFGYLKRLVKWTLLVFGGLTVSMLVVALFVGGELTPEEKAERERVKLERAAARAEDDKRDAEEAAAREALRAERAAEAEKKKRAEAEAKIAAEAENKRKGFHCLSGWDGAHTAFKEAVKNVMREPSSFEHIETRVTPADDRGVHKIVMQYRARNGFGGMNVGAAVGTFRNDTCAFTVKSVE